MQTFQHVAPQTTGTYRHRAPDSINAAVALAFARAGIPVFSCDKRKRPATARGHHDATTDLDTIRRWWARWPDALVGIPTGPNSGVWVLDVDGEAGRQSLNELMARLGVETIGDITQCLGRTPSGGLHLIFQLQPGERPRNRARDIGPGLDTRGVKVDGTTAGYIIAPGSTLPDGRRYSLVEAQTLEPIELPPDPFGKAAPAPRGLLYLATFNAAERAVIAASPELRQAIRDSEPAKWPAIVEQHRAAQREALAAHFASRSRASPSTPAHERQHRYVTSILHRELRALAAMQPGSGRNDAVFRLACRVGRWAHAGIITREQLTAAVLDACEANGLVNDDGRKAVLDTIASGLAKSAADALPELGVRA
jgi:hypothetical protein